MSQMWWALAILLAVIVFGLTRGETYELIQPPTRISMILGTSMGDKKASGDGDCTYLCNPNGHCSSPEFFECIAQQTHRYGVTGRARTALDCYGRRLPYVENQPAVW